MEENVKTTSREYLLSIMIPVYNEANTLHDVIHRVKTVPVQEGVRKEIIIVDDGSTDGTDSISEEPGRRTASGSCGILRTGERARPFARPWTMRPETGPSSRMPTWNTRRKTSPHLIGALSA